MRRFIPLLLVAACSKGAGGLPPLELKYLAPPPAAPAAKPFAGLQAKPYQTLSGHSEEVTCVAFTPDGRYLVSAGYGDMTLRLWSLSNGSELASAGTSRRVYAMGVSPDGSSVIAADVANNVTTYSIVDDRLMAGRSFEVKSGQWTRAALSPNGMLLAMTSFDKKISIVDLAGGKIAWELSTAVAPRGIAFSPSGTRLAVGMYDQTFRVYDLSKGEELSFFVPKAGAQSDVYNIAFSADEKLVATGHMDSSVTIWDYAANRNILNGFVRDASALSVAFSPDGSFLLTGHQNGQITLWDAKTGKQVGALQGHQDAVACLAFSGDGTLLASGSKDRKILIWR